MSGFDFPALSIDDVSVIEGDAGSTSATFAVSLSFEAVGGESVDFTTSDGTATIVDGDYLATSGTIHFLAGESSQTIDVAVNGDLIPEDDETFTIELTNPARAVIADSQGIATIENDDEPVAVEDDSSIEEFAISITSGNTTRGPAQIHYSVPQRARMRIVIFDLQGRLVAELVDATRDAGRHELVWTGRRQRGPAGSGLYFVHLQAAGHRVVERLMLLR